MFIEKVHTVYVKTNGLGHITDVNSSAFLRDTMQWQAIDAGCGDRYLHAQGNYFPLPVFSDGGACRYKLEDGIPVECTLEEIAAQEAARQPDVSVTQEERIAELEAQNEMLVQCILELSEIVYA